MLLFIGRIILSVVFSFLVLLVHGKLVHLVTKRSIKLLTRVLYIGQYLNEGILQDVFEYDDEEGEVLKKRAKMYFGSKFLFLSVMGVLCFWRMSHIGFVVAVLCAIGLFLGHERYLAKNKEILKNMDKKECRLINLMTISLAALLAGFVTLCYSLP